MSEATVAAVPPQSSSSSARGRGSHRRRRGRGAGPSAQTDQSSEQLPQRQSRRRQNFGSRVTNGDNGSAEPSSSRAHHSHAESAPPDHASLQARLTYDLLHGACECAICISTITLNHQTHSCQVCSAISHLSCISRWATRSVDELRDKVALLSANSTANTTIPLVQWRCPSCQSPFESDQIPKSYRCFCGRLANPPKPANRRTIPHSCGQPCQRIRPIGCRHDCPTLCHPGPCEPCTAIITESCFCGKESKRLQCSDVYLEKTDSSSTNRVKSCNQTCGKLLGCALHECSQVCHDGPCLPCQVTRSKICYCGQDQITETCQVAANRDRFECFGLEGSSAWTGEYACYRPCPWTYDCNIHPCQEVISCHPHTSSQASHCPLSPDLVSTCPCGKTKLLAPRQQCTDPVPTCTFPCGKSLPGCSHVCNEICHAGLCPPCNENIADICRCGNEKRAVSCSVFQQEGDNFKCNRICRAMRHCGRHPCGQKCCPLAFQEGVLATKSKARTKTSLAEAALMEDPTGIHTCPLICGRLLSCGIHTCDRNDHRGTCGRCLASEFREIACHCGGTILMPPIPCGTRIKCDLPCARRPPDCGHAKVPHACHEDDVACPPCSFLVEKPCQCSKHILVKNVRCSQEKVSCGIPCGEILACGAHRCRSICHTPGSCEEPCTQPCGKPKKFCGHPHEATCHAPSACSVATACSTMVETSCECGNIKQKALCGACTSRPVSSANKSLPCTDGCSIIKRNNALAEALGIDSHLKSPRARPTVSYPVDLVEFYLQNLSWCREIERLFADFLMSPRQTHLFQPMRHPQRSFVHELAELWSFAAESLDQEPQRSVHITKRPSSSQPANSMADAAAILRRPPIPVEERKPQQAYWNALLLKSVFGLDQDNLSRILSTVCSIAFELKWIDNEDVLFTAKPFPPLASDLLHTRLGNIKEAIAFTPTLTIGSVEGCHVDEVGNIEMRPAVASKRQQASVWSTRPLPSLSTNNAFQALDTSKPRTNGNTSAHMENNLSNGLYRPPIAVVAQENRPAAVDDWEDA